MYYLGLDIGSSSVKVAITAVATGKAVALVQAPAHEMEILSVQADWAEQDPDMWWNYVCEGIQSAIAKAKIDAKTIKGIGISYQMHGLVVVDKQGKPLRNAIIWCDSRAVEIGNQALKDLSEEICMQHGLNSPGNFTASKLKWVKDNEPNVYSKIHKYMLPGDYIAYKLSGTLNTTKNGLSEGILWDYKNDTLATWLLDYYQIDVNLTADIVENFSPQGETNEASAKATGLSAGIPIVYRAGDQPNNALALNILNPGEVATTGGTSGVIYAVSNQTTSHEPVRANHFAHVNYTNTLPNIGKMICINGVGIMYRWLKNNTGAESYEEMNSKAEKVPVGADGAIVIPFGNGAERMLNNTNIGAHFEKVNLNRHTAAHLYRAALEGIAFAFVYGMEILKNDRALINVIRAGNDNLFRSEIFAHTVTTLIGQDIEIYNTTGAIGAARAVGLQNADFKNFGESLMSNDYVMTYKPQADKAPYQKAYEKWKQALENKLKTTTENKKHLKTQ